MYTLKSFTRRLGIRASTLRSARRAGLKVHYVHKHAYVHGRDWIEYVLHASERRIAGAAPPGGVTTTANPRNAPRGGTVA